jgi:AbrB family looped-hinge helix DNA binding protein
MNRPRAKVGERGQITIPKRLRRSLGIQAGEEVEFEERDGALLVRRAARSDPLESLVGLLRDRIDVDAYLVEARGPAWSPSLDARPVGREKRRPRQRKA